LQEPLEVGVRVLLVRERDCAVAEEAGLDGAEVGLLLGERIDYRVAERADRRRPRVWCDIGECSSEQVEKETKGERKERKGRKEGKKQQKEKPPTQPP
jgi:hypothetical protein